MPLKFTFTARAEKNLAALPTVVQERILEKLSRLKNHPDIFSILKPLEALEPATHRLRVGQYRLLLRLAGPSNLEFWILKIAHRKDIYR